VSEELIVDFDIDDKGVSNIKVVQGLGDEINALVIKIIEKTRKKWEPLKINGQPIKTTLRFHFIFYLGVVELGIRFAK
jgi:outer membrane biosynthesis protein TonB